MGSIRLDMTMSLDGFIAGPDDNHRAPLGEGGFRLFNWLDGRNEPGPNGQVFREAMATGALLSGRRTYELADHWHGDHHNGVPIVVLTHEVPDGAPPGTVQFVTDPLAAATRAREVAGDLDVMVHGASAGQALLRIGQIDELELHVVPVLLGRGRQLFDHLPVAQVELELVRQLPGPSADPLERQVLHLRYLVRHS